MTVAVPETYWLEPGKILAGPSPARRSQADTIRRLRTLLAAGITMFVDLTEEGEHAPYAELLAAMPESRRRQVRHIRKPLVDHKVPPNAEIMRDILECLHSAARDGQCIYLHCRAGIGRTGVVAGCYLIQGGMTPDEALHHLGALWEESGRSAVWPHTPETDEQADYVRRWDAGNSGGEGAPARQPWWKPW